MNIGVLAGNLPFIGANNQVNINPFSGIIVGVILTFAGIIVLIAGTIVLILDRGRIRPKTHNHLIQIVCVGMPVRFDVTKSDHLFWKHDNKTSEYVWQPGLDADKDGTVNID